MARNPRPLWLGYCYGQLVCLLTCALVLGRTALPHLLHIAIGEAIGVAIFFGLAWLLSPRTLRRFGTALIRWADWAARNLSSEGR